MQQVTRYQAFDGSIFESRSQCLEHETLLRAVAETMSTLTSVPGDDTDFTNGRGYVQHEGIYVRRAMRRLVDISGVEVGNWMDDFQENPFPYRHSMLDRMITERSPKVVVFAWRRFTCMDDTFREWGQPYYAAHPEHGEQVEL